MERTRRQPISYGAEEEPIVLSKALLDILFKEKNGSDAIALYCFYYATAKWQRTNQPKATTEYTAEGLNWSLNKVRKVKDTLRNLHLIEDIRTCDDEKVMGYFIKVNFIWKQETPTVDSGQGGTVASRPPNALNNIYMVSTKKVDTQESRSLSSKERNEKYLPLAKYLSNIIRSKKNIEHSNRILTIWTNDIRKLVEGNKITYERVESALQWYRKNIGGQYIPVIESGSSLRDKFMKLEAAMEREKNSFQFKKDSKPPLYDDGIKYVWDEKIRKYRHSKSGEIYIP